MAPDGRLSGSATVDGFRVRRPGADAATAKAWRAGRPPAEAEADDLISWADLTGWKATCTCGWTGPSWIREQTLPGRYEGQEPDDAHLLDGHTVEGSKPGNNTSNHSKPVGRVHAAASALATARRDLDLAVVDARMQTPNFLGRHRPSYRHDPTGCPRALDGSIDDGD